MGELGWEGERGMTEAGGERKDLRKQDGNGSEGRWMSKKERGVRW